MSATTDRVSAVVDPVADRLALSVYDIDQAGGTLRVLLDRPGGIDIDTLTLATREISAALDEAEPMAGSYTLEVSSPGLERPLRRAEHFAAAVGDRVKVKLMPGSGGDRRADGILLRCDGETLTIDTDDGERTIELSTITKANTVFEWSPPPKPRSGAKGSASPSPNEDPESSRSGSSDRPRDSGTTGKADAPPPTTESSEEHR